MKRQSILALLLLGAASCDTVKQHHKLEQLNWVLGTWKMTTEEGQFIETWTKKNDTLLQGSGFFVAGNDTPFREELSIIDRNDTLYYTAITPKNEQVPVFFKERSFQDGDILFENPEHDFPQQIRYKKRNDTNIIATISGRHEGEGHSEEFHLIKQK